MALDRPLRILHLTTASEAGGLFRYVCDLALGMRELGHEVRVAGARGPWHDIFENAGIEWIETPLAGGPLALCWSIRRLRKYLLGQRVDIIHSHFRRTTAVARWLGRPRGFPPILYTVHLSDMPIRRWGFRWIDFGDWTHAPSIEARRWAVQCAGVAPERCALIPHGIKIDRWPLPTAPMRREARTLFGLSDADRVAAYVGRLDSPKNEEWLLDVAEAARWKIKNLKIIIAGAGPHLEQFQEQIAVRNLSNRVLWVGELADPLPVYHAADAFLLPSGREGFSLACAEAMCAGVPVLRTQTAGWQELIVENVTGRSTPIDRGAFVLGAIEFLSDGEALLRMGQEAARHIREHYTFDMQLQRTLEFYRRIVPDISHKAAP